MRFTTEHDAIDYIFQSRRRLGDEPRGLDEHTRDVSPTRRLLAVAGLLDTPREYAVITGSKGKGSTTVMMARLLQHLGHTVGTITSPHLVAWYERIRVNGRMIPQADFLRILSGLAPSIDEIVAGFKERQYFSPQGIFLAIALQWFNEQGVQAAVLEVGRGGRFDDMAVVPGKLALFGPIMLEHTQYLGPTLERIAWHKAGIIKTGGYAYSVPQPPEVLDVLRAEAETRQAEFAWIAPVDMGEFIADVPEGIRMRLHRYGELTLSLHGHYQIENATLAVQGAGNMHARLDGISHGSPEYVERIRAGLADVRWPGRCQKLEEQPAIYLDGATTVRAARSFIESVPLTRPVVTVAGIPSDRDYPAVYSVLAEVSDAMILTETDIHPHIHFPSAATATAAAALHCADVQHAPRLPQALELARARAGRSGTILLAVAQPLVGEAMLIWGHTLETI